MAPFRLSESFSWQVGSTCSADNSVLICGDAQPCLGPQPGKSKSSDASKKRALFAKLAESVRGREWPSTGCDYIACTAASCMLENGPDVKGRPAFHVCVCWGSPELRALRYTSREHEAMHVVITYSMWPGCENVLLQNYSMKI